MGETCKARRVTAFVLKLLVADVCGDLLSSTSSNDTRGTLEKRGQTELFSDSVSDKFRFFRVKQRLNLEG